MVIALGFVFDIIVAVLVYEYLKRDKEIEAFAAAVIIKVAYYMSSNIIMGQFDLIALVIYVLVMICVARLFIIIVKEIYKTKLHPILFIVIASALGAAIMSLIGQILYTLLFKLVTLFAATLQYTLDKIS